MKRLVSIFLILSVMLCSMVFVQPAFAAAGPSGNGSPNFNDVASNNIDTYVAVGDNGLIKISHNAATWIDVPVLTPENLEAVIWDGHQFVAVGTAGIEMISPDGMGWEIVPTGVNSTLYGINFDGTRYVAVGSYGTVLTSFDARAWMFKPAPYEADLYDVMWNGNTYYAVGQYGTLLTSRDAVQWSKQDLSVVPGGSGLSEISFNDIFFDGKQYIIAGAYGTVLSSTDGAAWKTTVLAPTIDLKTVTSDGKNYIIGGGNSTIYVSTDVTNWTPVVIPIPPIAINSVIYAMQNLVAVGPYTAAAYATNPYAWQVALTPVIRDHYNDVVWSPDLRLFVAVGTRGLIKFSNDGINWNPPSGYARVTEDLNGVTWSSGLRMFMAVGNNGRVLTSTTGGGTWTPTVRPIPRNLNSVAANNSTFVAVGEVGYIVTSANGNTWQYAPRPTTQINLNSIVFNGSNFCTVGDSGRMFYAVNPLSTWSRVLLSTYAHLQDVTFDNQNGHWVAVGPDQGSNPNRIVVIPYSLANIQYIAVTPRFNGVTSNWVATPNKLYITVGVNGANSDSYNSGTVWASFNPYQTNTLNDITYSPQLNMFVAVGMNETIVQY